jgi:NADP-dependent 3-hydroxy acid dehydrogenase YdfG
MSKKTILVCGHGPGISDAVARRFGAEGYAVALVARSAERIEKAAAGMKDLGVAAKAFPCDLGDAAAVTRLVADVHAALGPVAVVHWNAYATGAGDLTLVPEELRKVLDVGVHGLLTAVHAALPDLEAQKGAVLVTGGGLYMDDPGTNQMAVSWGAMGLAVAKAAQHKLAGLLSAKLAPKGIYVGEVIVGGLVRGTAFDQGNATLESDHIATRFWEMLQARKDVSTIFT